MHVAVEEILVRIWGWIPAEILVEEFLCMGV